MFSINIAGAARGSCRAAVAGGAAGGRRGRRGRGSCDIACLGGEVLVVSVRRDDQVRGVCGRVDAGVPIVSIRRDDKAQAQSVRRRGDALGLRTRVGGLRNVVNKLRVWACSDRAGGLDGVVK